MITITQFFHQLIPTPNFQNTYLCSRTKIPILKSSKSEQELGAPLHKSLTPLEDRKLHTLGLIRTLTQTFLLASLRKPRKRFKDWEPLLKFRRLDIDDDPDEQGYEGQKYDVVIASSVS